jgi:type IV pilus assembly protein PilY1
MKKLKLFLSTLLLAIAFNVEAKLPPPGVGNANVPANIYIMLDKSGSMGFAAVEANRHYDYPKDMAVDSNGNVFIVEQPVSGYTNHRVQKFNAAGNSVYAIGGRFNSSDGNFQKPHKIAVDSSDNIYVIDRQRIQKFSNNGTFLKSASLCAYVNASCNSNQEEITGVTVDLSGNIYVSLHFQILKLDSNLNILSTVASELDNRGRPVWSLDLDWYNGSIYVSTASNRVQKYTDSLVFQNSINNPQQWGRAIEVTSNGIYLSTGYQWGIGHYVEHRSFSGAYINHWGDFGVADSRFYSITGLNSDSSGNIYVASWEGHQVKKFDSSGIFKSRVAPYVTRMDDSLKVLEKLTSSSELTKGANFGLQLWASSYQGNSVKRKVDIDIHGAGKIYNSVKNAKVGYDNGWYHAGGGTDLFEAMKETKAYFTGANSPINPNAASCQKNFLIVISDGIWHNDAPANAIAKELLDTKGIQTLVIGFHTVGNSKYISLAKAGGSYPDTPLYSNNWQQLYETLSAYIRQAISTRLTFSAPVVLPNITSGDHIFQSTFTFHQQHQWKGQLSKFKLTADGSLGQLKWEAGAKLDAKSEASRKIWTVANKFGVSSTLNNFITPNAPALKNALWEGSGSIPTNDEATKLINFVRGLDSYDENNNTNTLEKRWKLGDIYNSRLTVVGKPNAKISNLATKSNTEAYYRDLNNYANFKNGLTCGGSCALRDEVVYVGANDGMLHAFDSVTGEELWAFIPPMMLQSLRSMISVTPHYSNSIYGVDGSPFVKDIYYNFKWRTVLISGMGRGGFGYFALDITNPKSPVFLYAFENKPTLSKIYHWDASGTRTDLDYSSGPIAKEYDYSKLGEAMSSPVIVAMPYGLGRKWVAVFGAGYNAGVNSNYGSAIYVIDLEDNGKVLKRIDLTDSTNSSSIANAMPAALVSITPDTTSKAKYKGSMIYGVDLEGKKWQLNLTDTGTLYDITQIFDAEATISNDRQEFFQPTPTIGYDSNLWSFYGTGNQQRLQRISSDVNNRIFGLKDKNFPTFKDVTSLNSTVGSPSMKNVSSLGSSCPGSSDDGWYLNLGVNERVTGKLAIYNEIIYASTYLPNVGQICSPGTGSLTEYSIGCGKKSRKIDLGEGIPTGAVIYNNRIYIGISGSDLSDVKDDQGNVVGKKKDNIIRINPKSGGASGIKVIEQESWREIFE